MPFILCKHTHAAAGWQYTQVQLPPNTKLVRMSCYNSLNSNHTQIVIHHGHHTAVGYDKPTIAYERYTVYSQIGVHTKTSDKNLDRMSLTDGKLTAFSYSQGAGNNIGITIWYE